MALASARAGSVIHVRHGRLGLSDVDDFWLVSLDMRLKVEVSRGGAEWVWEYSIEILGDVSTAAAG